MVDRPGEQQRRERLRPDVLAAIAAGGAVGTLARYEVAQLIHAAPGTYPWATFTTNLTGAFILGVFLAGIGERFAHTRYLRPFFAIGVVGAYTTFSTLAVETATLVKDDHVLLGVVYMLASVVTGLAVAYLGIIGARRLARGGRPAPG
jgi:fluoride exporter